MNDIGLVFAGGGAKGAYEIGVWKFLHEEGIDKKIKCVSGTSVGALNAALFAGSTYENAEALWLKMKKDDILPKKKVSIKSVLLDLALYGAIILTPGVNAMALLAAGTMVKIQKRVLINTIVQYASSELFLSRKGLIKLIKEGLGDNAYGLRNGSVGCLVTCLKVFPSIEVKRFELREYNSDEITNLLLASSAIPAVFKPVKHKHSYYIDGGFPLGGDNIPIEPLHKANIEHIIVVRLDQKSDDEYERKYPGTHIYEIKPSEDLGNFINGTLNFNHDRIVELIKLGYWDAKYTLCNQLTNLREVSACRFKVDNCFASTLIGTLSAGELSLGDEILLISKSNDAKYRTKVASISVEGIQLSHISEKGTYATIKTEATIDIPNIYEIRGV